MAKKNLNISLHFKQAALEFCLSWVTLTSLHGEAWLLPIEQVRAKSYSTCSAGKSSSPDNWTALSSLIFCGLQRI